MKGIVTVDDIVDVVQEEATEDIQKIGGMEALDAPYLEIGLLRAWCASAPAGCSVLFLGEMLTATRDGLLRGRDRARGRAGAVRAAHHQQRRQLRLAGVDAGHPRAGARRGAAARLVARRPRASSRPALALGRHPRRPSASCASCVWQAAVPALRRALPAGRAHRVAASLVGVVTFGTLAGSMLPLLLHRLGFDPASASAPFVATLVDVTGSSSTSPSASMLLPRHLVVTTRPTAPSVVVDTRPLSRILLERAVRPALLVGTALPLLVHRHAARRPKGSTEAGLKAIGVFVVCLVLWVTSVLPLMVTSLLASCCCRLAACCRRARLSRSSATRPCSSSWASSSWPRA